jgi:hypothetical protein
MTGWAKWVTTLLIAVVVLCAGLVAWSLAGSGTTKEPTAAIEAKKQQQRNDRQYELYQKLKAEKRVKHRRELATKRLREDAARRRVEETGITGGASQSGASHPPSTSAKSSGASSHSIAALEAEVSGSIGVAYAPLGSPESQTLGPLQSGHAWSSFKVPISVTVMDEQHGSLTAGQESLAASAITASDNAAAASLFSELEAMTRGRASAAIEQTLADAGAPTAVATAPPPPGAVSSWGQTDWPLASSTRFYNALACGAFGGDSETIIADMENVIPEQQWGLGRASFPPGTSVAFKAGRGPDGSESGPYLVRQTGIIRSAEGGAVVTIAAQDSSGSFEAGVADLDRVADWVADNVPLDGSC